MEKAQFINFIYYCYFYLLRFWNLLHGLVFPTIKKIDVVGPTIKDITSKFMESHKSKFLKTFHGDKKDLVNMNIENIFYSKNLYKEMLRDENNSYEKNWKKRIIFENTPRGNVIMYFDTYKLGFSYYSDQFMPYDILNAVAMKYVSIFYCRDFFMDEIITPLSSPILKLLEDDKKESKKETEDKEDTKENGEFTSKLKKAPFAKFKNYNMVSSKVATNGNENKEPEKQKERNRFIHLGKVSNFQFTQKIPKKQISFKSNTFTELFGNDSAQKARLNYRDFKNKIMKKDEILEETQ